jgi:hypothetical protein
MNVIPLSSLCCNNLGNKKAEVVFPLLLQHAGGQFLLSPKGPPSCWRAKPVIKEVAILLTGFMAEHDYLLFFCWSNDLIRDYKRANTLCQEAYTFVQGDLNFLPRRACGARRGCVQGVRAPLAHPAHTPKLAGEARHQRGKGKIKSP